MVQYIYVSDVYVSYFFPQQFLSLVFAIYCSFNIYWNGQRRVGRQAGMNANKPFEPKIILIFFHQKKKWLNPSYCMYKYNSFLISSSSAWELLLLLRKKSERSVLNSIVWWWWWKNSLVCGGINIYIKFCWKYAVDSLSVFVFQSLSERKRLYFHYCH